MARKNPYDAPVIPSLNAPGPAADDNTDVALRRTIDERDVLPVDDETNFGDIERVIGSGSSELEAQLLDIDPRALAERLASIDAPTVPDAPQPLSESPAARRDLAEDEPTLLGGPSVSVDPRELARKLAAQAKARLAAAEPPSKPEPQTLQEDPVALARRLAEEAKARLALNQPQVSEPEPVEPEVEPVAEEPLPEPVVRPAKPKKSRKRKRRSLADRAPRKSSKKSAAEALKQLGATPEPAPERVSPPAPPVEAVEDDDSLVPVDAPELMTPPRVPSIPEVQPESVAPPIEAPEVEAAPEIPVPDEEPEPPEAPAPQMAAHLEALLEVLPNAEILEERPVRRPNVFRALWQAHQARAVKDGRLELVGAASLLLHRVDALADGDLIGVRIRHDDVEWAAFVERDKPLVLALVARPEIYLAGLQ